MTDKTKRIFLWSGPRNISTTLMYSFAQRPDTKVYDEPLYAYYLSNSAAKEYHPDAKLVMSQMECNGEKVIEQMTKDNSAEVVFFKNMTHHLIDLDKEFMKEGINIILTREPEQMLSSFHKVIKNPKLNDVGYKDQLSLVHYFEKEFIPFIVIDSKDILQNPKYYLRKVCELADVQFHEEMLLWPAKPRIEDGIWAKHWYSNVHKSTGFMKYKKKTEDFPIELRSLLKECQFYYDELMVRI